MAVCTVLEKSKEFAIEIVRLCQDLREKQREFVLSDQLLRSATSVGANIHESKYAQSDGDFVSKRQIALKECYESEYWLELLSKSGYLKEGRYQELRTACGAIRRMLIASIKTTKARR